MDLRHLLTRNSPVRALVVDDEDILRTLFIRAMKAWGIEADAAETLEEAREFVANHEYRIILVDIHMGGEDGSALLPLLTERQPKAVVMMISGDQDIRTAIRCLTSGAYDFLLKPIDLEVLRAKITSGLEYMALKQEHRHYLEQMEEMAAAERMKSHQTFMSAVDALIRALEAKDLYTKGHSARVAIIVEGMAAGMNLRPHEIDQIVTAASCHDIGKIGVADHVLQKKGSLTPVEFDHIRTHPTIGARIVAPIFVDQPDVTLSVRHHHERFDGSGYPDGLRGEDIPLGARIIAVADAYDAMTSNRVYRAAKSNREAIGVIIRETGRQFCPQAVRAFMRFMAYLPRELTDSGESWDDKRRELRYDHHTTLLVSVDEQDSLVATALDVSQNGMRIRGAGSISPGEVALLDMGEDGIQSGVVQWARPSTGGKLAFEAGLRLTETETRYRDTVERLARREEERRIDRRIERVIPANVISSTHVFKLSILNISMEGAFIQTREPMSVGETLRLSFALPERQGQGDVELEARVVRVVTLREATRSPNLMPGVGVEFTEFFGDSRARLHDVMVSRILMIGRHYEPTGDATDENQDEPSLIN